MEGVNKFYKVRHDNFLKKKQKNRTDLTRSNCDIP